MSTKQTNMEKGFKVKSLFASPYFLVLLSGFYPFIHYYNSNFDMANSWQHFVLLLGICFALPVLSYFLLKLLLTSFKLERFQKFLLPVVNLVFFSGLLAYLVFTTSKKELLLVVALAALLAFIVVKFINKIIVFQLLLGIIGLVSFVPKVFFILNYSDDWSIAPDNITKAKFKHTPNVYVIQPDGYVNFSTLDKEPYFYKDTSFKNRLINLGFTHYPNFRSNYYSTLTSNASMFAMKHHYYGNTYKGNLKSYGTQQIIVGENNVLKTFLNNGYTAHLFTDNTYFLGNLKRDMYATSNVNDNFPKLFDTDKIQGVSIVKDLETHLQKDTNTPSFNFIEKTTPAHIVYANTGATAEEERNAYLKRLEVANQWLEQIITSIKKHDENALIVIVADHGGFVGLTHTKVSTQRELNSVELNSAFSAILSVHWPSTITNPEIVAKTNVNLFRNIFSILTEDHQWLNSFEEASSYLPLKTGSSSEFYKVIDDQDKYIYTLLTDGE